jgi:hypothetical protein
MAKNRVEEQWLAILKQFSEGYWDKELEQAHELFEVVYPNKDDKDYIKKTTFIDNAKRNKLMMLKYLAQSLSGAVHPTGHNNEEEKQQAAKLIELAQKRLEKNDTNTL